MFKNILKLSYMSVSLIRQPIYLQKKTLFTCAKASKKDETKAEKKK